MVSITSTGTRAPFFALAIDSGLRRSEPLGLQWQHVDLEGAVRFPSGSPRVNPNEAARGSMRPKQTA